MRAEDGVRVGHMVAACEAAIAFVAGRGCTDLDMDLMLRFAIVRAIEVIGEAASKISEETRAAHGEIPWKAITGMRNRLVHAYFEIDTDIVWVAVTEEIPALLCQLQSLAANE